MSAQAKDAIYTLPEFRDSYMGGAIRNAAKLIADGEPDVALTLLNTVKERMGL